MRGTLPAAAHLHVVIQAVDGQGQVVEAMNVFTPGLSHLHRSLCARNLSLVIKLTYAFRNFTYVILGNKDFSTWRVAIR